MVPQAQFIDSDEYPSRTTTADAHGADGREERGDATGAVCGHGC